MSKELSNCCSAKIIEDSDVCSKCKEHCGVMEENQTLSDKRIMYGNELEIVYKQEDVRDAVLRLKEKLCICKEPYFVKEIMRCLYHDYKIDEIFGEKLTGGVKNE
ncbi:MAG: hypothetical protein HC874_27355 [Richelia sp. SL_2_1]|nr:hypothetical protein [Richelia sp. SL_2_1]